MTMLLNPFSLLVPHYCCSCGEIGAILCSGCYYDITSEILPICLYCRSPSSDGNCSCSRPFGRSWRVGEHAGTLQSLVANSKFDAVRQACDVEADLLDATLPQLPANACLVPVPTIARHIRRRGYGHTERIVAKLAKRRHVSYKKLVGRKKQYIQHGKSRQQRQKQAKQSYRLLSAPQLGMIYLLVDDVYTTGSTIEAIARLLQGAGVKRDSIWVAVVALQPRK